MLYGDREAIEPLFAAVQMQFTVPADFAGTPTLTVPCGVSDDGRPYALQFMGRRLSEPTLCRFGHAYEGATGWHDRHPPVASGRDHKLRCSQCRGYTKRSKKHTG